jgi:hypothetical protein
VWVSKTGRTCCFVEVLPDDDQFYLQGKLSSWLGQC